MEIKTTLKTIKIDNFIKKIDNIRILLFLLIILSIFFLIWAIFFKWEVKIKTKGIVVCNDNIQEVINSNEGYVEWVIDNNIEFVKKGDLLLLINSDNDEEEVLSLEYEYLMKQKNYNDLNTLKQLLLNEEKNYFFETDYYKFLYENYLIDRRSYKNEIEFCQFEYDNNLKLFKSEYISEKELKSIKKELEKSQYLFDKLKIELLFNAEKDLLTCENEINNYKKEIAILKRIIRNSKYTSNIDGKIIHRKKINTGDFLMEYETLFEIIPTNTNFLIDIYIENKDIVKIAKDQDIAYILPASNSNKDIRLKGKVVKVNNNVFNNNGNYLIEGNIL
ncbi:MAG: HlyD family secretion protein, partial [Novosphingobium sp.]|nr:HlyD family secretion protein [Novosphingobium sp.]